MRKFFKAMGLIGMMSLAAAASAPGEAKAESPIGWQNTHPVYQFSYVNPAGHRILFSFHDAWHPATGRTGIVVTTHRVRDDGYHVGIDIKAIPASDLIEFSHSGYLIYTRVYLRGFWDPIVDALKDVAGWIKDQVNQIKRVIDALKDVAKAVKELVKAVLELAKEVTTIFSKKAVESGNPKAVVRYATNVADASAMNASLAYKVGWAFDVTLGAEPDRAARRELVRNLVQTIKEL